MKTIKQDFGKIYANPPTHGVYSENNLRIWGDRAVAIHHAWSERAAQELADSETILRQEKCVVVFFAQ